MDTIHGRIAYDGSAHSICQAPRGRGGLRWIEWSAGWNKPRIWEASELARVQTLERQVPTRSRGAALAH